MTIGKCVQLTSAPCVPSIHTKDSASLSSASTPSASSTTGDSTSPTHYSRLTPQPIEVIEAWGLPFHLANVLKYISRAGHKASSDELRDLKAARWYLDRWISIREGTAGNPPPQV